MSATADLLDVNVWLALAVGLAPGLAQTAGISVHPVWSEFARISLRNPRSRLYWLTGFGLLWLLAGVGFVALVAWVGTQLAG